MMRCGSFQSAVIESDPPIAGHRIIAFASSVFVRRDFAKQELANPQPGLNARLIASIDSGRPAVLSPDELRAANTQCGLDLVVLCPQIRRSALDPGQLREAEMYIGSTFLQFHAGFRLRRIVSEAVDDYEKKHFTEPTGIGRIVSDFREFYERHPDTAWGAGRSLAAVTIEDAFRVAGHIGTTISRATARATRVRTGASERRARRDNG